MSQKLNCWQFKNCGREKGGILAEHLGVCPVAKSMKHDGTNGGIAAGRVCWRIINTDDLNAAPGFCKNKACHNCEFYRRVLYEEEENTSFKFASVVAQPVNEEKIKHI